MARGGGGGVGGGKFDGRTFGAYRKVLRYMCTHPQYAVHPWLVTMATIPGFLSGLGT